jgi:hypothetical protein
LYDYLLVIVPVGLYVALEALHKGEPEFFVTSPEWAIATIILVFQAMAGLFEDLARPERSLARGGARIEALVALVIIVAASVNAYMGMNGGGPLCLAVRLILFGIVSVGFFLFVGGTRFLKSMQGQPTNG